MTVVCVAAGRDNVYSDLGERDDALSPCKTINEMVSRFLLSLLEGQQQERVVTRLISSLEWKHVQHHLKSLQLIMQLKEHKLLHKTRSAVDVEVATMEARLIALGCTESWREPSWAEKERMHKSRVAEIRKQLKNESFRLITIVQKLGSFKFPADKSEGILEKMDPIMGDQDMMQFFL